MIKLFFYFMKKLVVLIVFIVILFIFIVCINENENKNDIDVIIIFEINDIVFKELVIIKLGILLSEIELFIYDREYFIFNGWYIDEVLIKFFDFLKEIEEFMKLYVKWIEDEVFIYCYEFLFNGGNYWYENRE